MVLPNTLYIGAAKAGSSWIEHNLRSHPDAYVCQAKDTYFFCRDEVFERGIDWYSTQFSAGRDKPVRVELCHDYLHSPTAARRAHDVLDRPRLLVSLRKPSDRALSAYANALRHHYLPESFSEMLYSHDFLGDECRYATHLKSWLKWFPPESFCIVDFSELQRNPDAVWRQITEFVGLSPTSLDDGVRDSVRPRSSARSRSAARLGKAAARHLRRLGREETLGRLKRSSIVDRLFYRRGGGTVHVDQPVLDGFDRAMLPEIFEIDQLFGTSLVESWRLDER